MSIRSKIRFEGGLPVGGRSSGGRPKKKVKAKLKKSPARKKAEADLEYAKERRESAKQMVDATSQKLGRTPKKRAKKLMDDARRTESTDRRLKQLDKKSPPKGDEIQRSKEASRILKRRAAERRLAAKKAEAGTDYLGTDKSARSKLKREGSRYIKATGKKVAAARKKLANTPRFGGKGRFSSGTRNRFVTNVD